MTIRYAPAAAADLRSAVAYLLRHNPEAARKFQAALLKLLDQLDDRTIEGPEVRMRSGKVVRTWPIRPWRVYYVRDPDGILSIIRIYHERREPLTARRRARSSGRPRRS